MTEPASPVDDTASRIWVDADACPGVIRDILFRAAERARVEVVLVANHVSFLDFLLVGLAARRSDRSVRFLARHDIWTNPVARPLITAMRHVPVDREAPAAAYLRARSLLRDGRRRRGLPGLVAPRRRRRRPRLRRRAR